MGAGHHSVRNFEPIPQRRHHLQVSDLKTLSSPLIAVAGVEKSDRRIRIFRTDEDVPFGSDSASPDEIEPITSFAIFRHMGKVLTTCCFVPGDDPMLVHGGTMNYDTNYKEGWGADQVYAYYVDEILEGRRDDFLLEYIRFDRHDRDITRPSYEKERDVSCCICRIGTAPTKGDTLGVGWENGDISLFQVRGSSPTRDRRSSEIRLSGHTYFSGGLCCREGCSFWLCSSNFDKSLRLWDLQKQMCITRKRNDGIDVQYSSDKAISPYFLTRGRCHYDIRSRDSTIFDTLTLTDFRMSSPSQSVLIGEDCCVRSFLIHPENPHSVFIGSSLGNVSLIDLRFTTQVDGFVRRVQSAKVHGDEGVRKSWWRRRNSDIVRLSVGSIISIGNGQFASSCSNSGVRIWDDNLKVRRKLKSSMKDAGLCCVGGKGDDLQVFDGVQEDLNERLSFLLDLVTSLGSFENVRLGHGGGAIVALMAFAEK